MAVQWTRTARGKRYRKSGYKITGSKRQWKRPSMDWPAGRITGLGLNAGFPSELITKVRYCQIVGLTSTAQVLAKNAFRMNSLFDPDSTGLGHQPLFSDAFATVYSNYVVLGSKITATFVPYTSGSGPVFVGVVCNGSSTLSSSTPDNAAEQNNSSTGFMPGYAGGGVKTLVQTYSPTRDLGLSPDDDTAGAAFGSNPSQNWFAHVCFAESSSTSPSSCYVMVRIEYTVKLKKIAYQAEN